MSKLKEAVPELSFDEKEMRRWGFIWRIGTASSAAIQDEDDAVDSDAKKPAGKKVQPLTAKSANLPLEWKDIVDESKTPPSAFNKKQGMDFGTVFDRAVGAAIASMLGDIPLVDYAESKALQKTEKEAVKAFIKAAKEKAREAGVKAPKNTDIQLPKTPERIDWTANELLPPIANCVEVGPARIIGGIRPQNFDVAYRPDGPRIVYDSKALNDASSIPKNWQNMVNDLGTEATTVHTRFPYAIVAFIFAVPKPAIRTAQLSDLIRTLERLATREHVIDQAHLAEAIAFVVWDPETGKVDSEFPPSDSHLHLSKFMAKIHRCYVDRYKGLPPHDK